MHLVRIDRWWWDDGVCIYLCISFTSDVTFVTRCAPVQNAKRWLLYAIKMHILHRRRRFTHFRARPESLTPRDWLYSNTHTYSLIHFTHRTNILAFWVMCDLIEKPPLFARFVRIESDDRRALVFLWLEQHVFFYKAFYFVVCVCICFANNWGSAYSDC